MRGVSEHESETYRDLWWNLRVGLVDGGLYGSVIFVAVLGVAQPWWPLGGSGGWSSLLLWAMCVLVFVVLYSRASVTRAGDQIVVRNPFRTVEVHRGAAWSPGRSQVWTGQHCVVVKTTSWPSRVRVVAVPERDEWFLTAR
jgi:hypothetical protein